MDEGIFIAIGGLLFYFFMVIVAIKNRHNRSLTSNTFGPFVSSIRYNKLSNKIHALLMNESYYYQHLDPRSRLKFQQRVIYFISEKEFIPRKIEEVTTDQKILISASAIQLTFGLKDFLLDHFSKIIVFPKIYYSRFQKAYHKGEVNLGGAIVLSYEDFLKGNFDYNDGVNLGLHEMAHALRFNFALLREYHSFFSQYFENFQKLALKEFKKMQNDKSDIFRTYARSNIDEFFAICVENFFERPEKFKRNLPELYNKMSVLLNQDPTQANPVLESPRERQELDKENFIPIGLIYQSKISVFKWIQMIVFYTLLFSLIFTLLYNGAIEYAVLVIAFAVFRIIKSFLSVRTYRVYENCIQVNNDYNPLLGNKNFGLDQLININIISRGRKEVILKYIKNGNIFTKRYNWYGSFNDLKNFYRALKRKGVMITHKRF